MAPWRPTPVDKPWPTAVKQTSIKPVPPIADRRTGKVSLPTIWTALAERVLDPDENEGTRKLCAETLCRLLRASQEKGGLSGDSEH